MAENNENWKIIRAEDIGWNTNKLVDEIYRTLEQRENNPSRKVMGEREKGGRGDKR